MCQTNNSFDQALQAERLILIGRLTAALVHETNNAMQCIQGALNLAVEELDDRQAVADYLSLSLVESRRIIRLMDHIRQIYRPQQEYPIIINLNALVKKVLVLTADFAKQQSINLQFKLSPSPVETLGIESQILLVVASLVLNLCELVGNEGGGDLLICTGVLSSAAQIEFTSDAPLSDLVQILCGNQHPRPYHPHYSMIRRIIQEHAGEITLADQDSHTIVRLFLPITDQT